MSSDDEALNDVVIPKGRGARGGRDGGSRKDICGPASADFFLESPEINDHPEKSDKIIVTDIWNDVRRAVYKRAVQKKSKSGKTTYYEHELFKTGVWIPSQEAAQACAAKNDEFKKNDAECDQGGRYSSWSIPMNEMKGIKWDGEDEVHDVSCETRHTLHYEGKKFFMLSSSGEQNRRG